MAVNISVCDQMRFAVNYAKFKLNQKQLRTKEKILANTTHGEIMGVKWKCLYGERSYFSFEGIPYAKPPVGKLRFKAPEEPEPWTGVKSCKRQRQKPSQFNIILNKTVGSEDCLYMNVYTPELKPTKPLPVLIWIYGGAFQMGETSREIYSPDYFMMDNVILCTFTYRLGALGFLSLQDSTLDVPGNAGLKDQVLALKWVKNNCQFFGGDPNNITVFGESAGGASVHFMMLTEQTKDLFHKGVAMSGTALACWATINPANWSYRLAKATGYHGKDIESDILEHLRQCKSSTICKVSFNLLTHEERHERILFSFGPVVEPYITSHCVIPESPLLMMRNCWSNKIPMLVGGTSFEGLLAFPDVRKYPFLLKNAQFEYLAPKDADLSKEEAVQVGEVIRKTYFGDEQPSRATMLKYCDMCSYKFFWHSIHRTLLSRSHYAAGAPTYLYRFDFDSKFFNFMRIMLCGRKIRGTCHSDDLCYMFYNAAAIKLQQDSLEFKAIRHLTGMVVEFANSGNPNALFALEGKQHANEPWQPVEKDDETFKCLNISNKLEVMDLPESEKLQLWDSFYENKSLLF